jgi:chromosome segregation ATPase
MTNQLRQKLPAAQDAQQNKQLDKREAEVARREALVNNYPKLIAKAKILEEQISYKEKEKSSLEAELLDIKQDYEVQITANEEQKAEYAKLERTKATLSKECDTLLSRKLGIEQEVSKAKDKLEEVNHTILDQKRYFKEQEKVIDETFADWNAQLNEFHLEAEHEQDRKNVLSGDIIRLEQAKAAMVQDNENKHAIIAELDETYKLRVEQYKTDLSSKKVEVQKEEQKLLELDLRNKGYMEVLASREQALTIKETALNKQETDLNMRERNLKMKLGLLNVSL